MFLPHMLSKLVTARVTFKGALVLVTANDSAVVGGGLAVLCCNVAFTVSLAGEACRAPKKRAARTLSSGINRGGHVITRKGDRPVIFEVEGIMSCVDLVICYYTVDDLYGKRSGSTTYCVLEANVDGIIAWNLIAPVRNIKIVIGERPIEGLDLWCCINIVDKRNTKVDVVMNSINRKAVTHQE